MQGFVRGFCRGKERGKLGLGNLAKAALLFVVHLQNEEGVAGKETEDVFYGTVAANGDSTDFHAALQGVLKGKIKAGIDGGFVAVAQSPD